MLRLFAAAASLFAYPACAASQDFFEVSALLQNEAEVDEWATFASTYHEDADEGKHFECDGELAKRFPAAVAVNSRLALSSK